MSRSKIKANLRAADRRRRRRPAEKPNTDQAATPPQARRDLDSVDVAGLIVEAILSANQKRTPLRDSVVFGTLRSLARQSVPEQAAAKQLYDQVQAFLAKRDVGLPATVAAAKELSGIAQGHMGSDSPDGFVQYLAFISG
ncbi:hypothetical protein [Roseiconus lacunae]|uniref:Uncharacterized protein n=1 Tax=Roseiconus lacunae TaxID=2605694 RepID=A0ABT7PSD8_9BACT|nr:hypothetical protein [Roseiconus lacunae]MCD0460255.1 hypothetical protein [Roseiconus lacunae]MDM4019268.1 hypothetical protein [Roseiconus lacunae]WRQ51917.1 hypothetical protein U8335_05120 [Stieleria sp. HD01]